MFTKQDYKKYFTQAMDVEIKMIGMLEDILSDVSDQKTAKVLRMILKDEFRHKILAEEIIQFIKD